MKRQAKRKPANTIARQLTQLAEQPMTGEQLAAAFKRITDEMADTCKRKNADYAGVGGGSDAFANFKMIETLSHGEISAEDGFLTRMTDKLSRVISLFQTGQAQVVDESIHDTLQDLAVYSILLSIYLEQK